MASTTRRCVGVVSPLAVVAAGLLAAAPAQAVSTTVVISEVYGGGGNSGATLTHDFIELANTSSSAIDLTGWKVNYYSSSGNLGGSTALTGSIAPGTRYLVQEAKGAAGTEALPTPDATGTLALSGSAGSVSVTDASGQVVDLLGYGAVARYEGSPAAGTSNTTSSTRAQVCTDTDNNAADFATVTPTPQSSASGTVTCDGSGDPTDPPPANDPETIAQIQGTAHLSPLTGQAVNGVTGVVVATGPYGFWMQSTTPDDNPATSEGIYVYTRTAGSAAVGDQVSVDGNVTEYRPGGSGGNDNTTITEIVSPTVTVLASGQQVPAPVVIGEDRVAPAQTIEQGDPGNVEDADAIFRVDTDAIDFYESLEGMRVGVRDAEVVGPTKSFGEMSVVPGSNVNAVRTPIGGVVYGGYDQPNAQRLQLDDAIIGAGNMPLADVGDTLSGLTTGVVDYSYSNYKVLVDKTPTLVDGGVQREVTEGGADTDLAVATFNVENLAPENDQSKFDRLAGQIVTNLKAPDILALEEIQDNSGAANDGTVDSYITVHKLIDAIEAAGGPTYDARWVNPENNQDGGQPGGNIRSVFLFRPDRGVRFVDRGMPTATTASTPVATATGGVKLSVSPGRINPTSSAWASSRKPLVGEFKYRGATYFATAVHFNSKGGDDPLFGRWQQPVRSSEVQRHQQAQEVRSFVDQILSTKANAKVIVLGDVNDFEFSQTADILVGSGTTAMKDLPRTLAAPERWTYIYEGNSQVLDHILLSPSLWKQSKTLPPKFTYDIVHTNSPFHDQDSDHDPQVVRLHVK